MTIFIICLIIATAMPIVFKAPLAFAMNQAGGYDNRHPREQQKKLIGFGARAKAVHENSFEALLMYLPGAVATLSLDAVDKTAVTLALFFVVSRGLYAACYWYNLHILRSTFWLVGFATSIALLVNLL